MVQNSNGIIINIYLHMRKILVIIPIILNIKTLVIKDIIMSVNYIKNLIQMIVVIFLLLQGQVHIFILAIIFLLNLIQIFQINIYMIDG